MKEAQKNPDTQLAKFVGGFGILLLLALPLLSEIPDFLSESAASKLNISERIIGSASILGGFIAALGGVTMMVTSVKNR